MYDKAEGLATTYVYDSINRITVIHRPDGISIYNEEYQITELANSCDDCGWVVGRYAYTYDERGFSIGETAVEYLAGYAWNGKLEKHDKNAAFAYRTVKTDRTFTYDDAGTVVENRKYVNNESNQAIIAMTQKLLSPCSLLLCGEPC